LSLASFQFRLQNHNPFLKDGQIRFPDNGSVVRHVEKWAKVRGDNLAYRFTSSHSAAEDLTQEVFIRVYRSLSQYDATLGDLSNWLMRLARNLVIDDYRKRQRTPTESGDDLANHEYHLPTATDNPQRTLERKERRLQVLAAINKLSHDLRECVILRDIEELTYQDIVDLLKIPEGTVKSRINRGRIELAKVLRRMKVNPD